MTTLRMALALICVLAGPAYTIAEAQQSSEQTAESQVRIGTFDSRALAIAYARSEAFEQHVKELKAELERARADGDEERVKELESEGPALQALLHKQGFSTWPVDNILDQIRERVPQIAEQAGVDVIVCKWDIVYPQASDACIDITALMVEPFEPSENTLEILKALQNQDPVPLEAVQEHESK